MFKGCVKFSTKTLCVTSPFAEGNSNGRCSSEEVLVIKKVIFLIIISEIIVIVIGNYFCFSLRNDPEDKTYLVEIKRMIDEMGEEKVHQLESEKYSVEKDKYPHIISIRKFDSGDFSSKSYVVKEINGQLYRIEYRQEYSTNYIFYMNIGLGMAVLLTIFLTIYIKKAVLKPFDAMEEMTFELAKGNLSKPMQEEKSHVFGKFLWGMDMLREKLEESREREREYQKERKTLMLSLSHDIKTPLSAIELYEKALSSGLYDSEEKKNEAYEGIRKNVGDLRRYIDEIVAASREDFLALEVREGEFYLQDALEEVKVYYNEKFNAIHTEFTVEKYGNPLMYGDRDRVVEVLQNLLENAIKYGDGERVNISFSEEDEAVLIHVINTGNTPKEDEMVHLFDSFYRGSNAGDKKGSGLGLYISRELMKKMDGYVYAEKVEAGFASVIVLKKI